MGEDQQSFEGQGYFHVIELSADYNPTRLGHLLGWYKPRTNGRGADHKLYPNPIQIIREIPVGEPFTLRFRSLVGAVVNSLGCLWPEPVPLTTRNDVYFGELIATSFYSQALSTRLDNKPDVKIRRRGQRTLEFSMCRAR